MEMLSRVELTNEADVVTVMPIIENIWQEVFTPIIGEHDVAYMLENYQSVPVILAEIAAENRYFALMLDNMIVGYTAYKIESDALYISKLYISEDFRGKGYMREIFAWYDDLARTRGLKQRLKVNQGNQRAIDVYQHLGFQLVGEQQVDIGGGVIMNDYIFEKESN